MAKTKVNQVERTEHGDNIADQIQGDDAYGANGTLTLADIYNILDQIHGNLLYGKVKNDFIEEFMDKILDMNPEIET